MAKQGVVPDDLTRPFWEAANEERLVIQYCTVCERLQHPPAPRCYKCGSDAGLAWKELSGRGTIYNYGVVHDCPIRLLQDDQPFNVAVIMLEEDPGIQMYSHLPGDTGGRGAGPRRGRGGVRGNRQRPEGPRMARGGR